MKGSFSEYFKVYDKYTLYALLPALAASFILDKVFSLQPPWPRGSSYITAFLELGIVFYAFTSPMRSKKKLRAFQRKALVGAIFLFAIYFVLYSLFVYESSVGGYYIVGGFECTPIAQNVIATELGLICPLLNSEALAAAQYDETLLWTRRSIIPIEISMFLSWSLLFMLMTYMFASTAAYISQKTKE